MKIKRYLRRHKPNGEGYVPILFSISWLGHRLRFSSQELTHPDHWDDTSGCIVAKRGTQHAVINPRLDALSWAARDALTDAARAGNALTPAALQAALDAILRPDAAPAAAAATAAAAVGTVAELWELWISEQAARINPSTGRATSPNTLAKYRSTWKQLAAFAAHRGQPLALLEMDLTRFYGPFRDFIFGHVGNSLNTFGKYIDHLKQFLKWCELDQELAVNRKYLRFVAPERYVGVDALSEAELRQLAALDFTTDDLRGRLFVTWGGRGAARDSAEFGEYVYQVALARDKFLLCAYTGLSIVDADEVNWSDIRIQPAGMLISWDRTKSGNPCYIPFEDDDLFKPVALARRHGAGGADLLVPVCAKVNAHLKTIARLIDLKRLELSTKIGRKTFVTLKLFQGVPQRMVMMATGHTTEASFNRYVGIDVLKLLEQFRRHAPRAGLRAAA